MRAILVLSFFILSYAASAQTSLSSFFTQADNFFSEYVKAGRVDYKAVMGDDVKINQLYKAIGEMNLSGASAEDKKAFYINAYNLVVIYQVSKYYPLKSPLDQSGFFNKVKHKVAGESLTLNALEIKKLILTYKDPRIHFALACAAVSCPPLASFAYKPATLNQQLDERTKKSVNNPDWLRVHASQNSVELSKIFEWYKDDFSMNGAKSVISFINQYRTKKIPDSYKVGYYEYDWNLNES